jgi:ABC-type phosphate/phosphonate transport system permease subunit
MHSYHIVEQDLTWKEQMRHTVLPTAVLLVLFLLGWRIASHRWPGMSIVTILVIANFAQAFFEKRQEAEYDLEIDEGDGFRLVRDGSVRHKVRRDHLHYVGEWGSGPFKRLEAIS